MVFFFFQAEDGIRDYKVTGVQTCALPISLRERLARIERSLAQLTGALAPPSASVSPGVPAPRVADSSALPTPPTPSMPSTAGAAPLTGGGGLWGFGRSGERRGGGEGRFRGGPDYLK